MLTWVSMVVTGFFAQCNLHKHANRECSELPWSLLFPAYISVSCNDYEPNAAKRRNILPGWLSVSVACCNAAHSQYSE